MATRRYHEPVSRSKDELPLRVSCQQLPTMACDDILYKSPPSMLILEQELPYQSCGYSPILKSS